jgi:NADPH2:quinone reductase
MHALLEARSSDRRRDDDARLGGSMTSRAVVMRELGGPEVLRLEDVVLAPLRAGELRIRALASAVNHSDLEIRAGHWTIRRVPRFPYVPGLEVVGEVVELAPGVVGPGLGDRVWTMMQGLGGVRAERDGGYAEHVTVAAAAVALLPPEADPIALASIGLAGVTAHGGLSRLGDLAGRRVLITGPSGGVGAVAVQLARTRGAEVIPLGRDASPPAPSSVDAVLDVVAGPVFPSLVQALRPGGRYCIVGAIAGGDVQFDAWSLLEGLTLTGYSTESLDGEGLRAATGALLSHALPDVERTVVPLEEAARAHAMLEHRQVRGRVVLVP